MAGSFSYNENLASDLSYLRFRIGDTKTAYRKFYDEELNEILDRVDNDIEEARGECFAILAQDSDRLVKTKDATAGAFTLLALMQFYGRKAAEWSAS